MINWIRPPAISCGTKFDWVVIGGSLLLTNISTEQLVGLNGVLSRTGWRSSLGKWRCAGHARNGPLLSATLSPRRHHDDSLYFGRALRSGDTIVRFATDSGGCFHQCDAVCARGGAIHGRDVFDISARLKMTDDAALWLMIVAIGFVGGVYAIFGGLRAVAISDTLNGVGLLVAGLLLPILGLLELGGGSAWSGWVRLQTTHRDRLYPWGDANSELPVGTLVSGVALLHLYYWCTNQYCAGRVRSEQPAARSEGSIVCCDPQTARAVLSRFARRDGLSPVSR